MARETWDSRIGANVKPSSHLLAISASVGVDVLLLMAMGLTSKPAFNGANSVGVSANMADGGAIVVCLDQDQVC